MEPPFEIILRKLAIIEKCKVELKGNFTENNNISIDISTSKNQHIISN